MIEVGDNVEGIERSFRRHCNSILSLLRTNYATLLADMPEMLMDVPVADNLNHLLTYVVGNQLPPLYIIIDEYDNFANQL